MDYSLEVLRRFASAHELPELAENLPGVVSAEAEDRSLNVWLRFQVQAREGRIEAAGFRIFGCPHAVAAASWVAEWLPGQEIGALAQLNVHDLASVLNVPVEKLGKLLRIEDALLACWREFMDSDELNGS